jgi:hypothetical protein
MNAIRRFLYIGAVASALCCTAVLVQAAMPGPSSQNLSSLKNMIDQASLVFAGQVESIAYALSEPSGPEKIRVPYTFVTYRVDKVFSGATPGGLVTLQFAGGFDPQKNLYMATSQTPQFDVGDQDILFVQNNTQTICPLVSKINGRLRIIGGKVYSEDGRSVLSPERGSLRYGPRYKLPEVETTTVNGKEYTTLKSGPSATSATDSNAVEATDMMAAIEALAVGAEPKQTFINADPKTPFNEPDMGPAPPPAEKTE